MVVAPPKLLTYTEYLTEGEISERREILDGESILMPSPIEDHQICSGNLFVGFRLFEQTHRQGKALYAPLDVLIQRRPLRVRQPDLLFISNARRASNRVSSSAEPFDPAPELVVEILSPSDTRSVLDDKIADYIAVNVLELWAARQGTRTVEVLRLTPPGPVSVAVYGMGETAQSITFPDLNVAVADIFAV